MIIGNGFTALNSNKFYKDKHTAKFLKDLADANESVAWLEHVVCVDVLSTENILGGVIDDRVQILNKKPKENSSLGKYFNYFHLLAIILKKINQNDYIYCFYEGTLSKLVSFICIVLGKNYGLYIRTDCQPDHYVNCNVVKNAKFILANGYGLIERIKNLNRNVHLVSPMIDFPLDLTESRSRKCDEENKGKDELYKILYVGRIEEAKGLFILIDAIKLLESEHINISVDIVGGGQDFDAVIRYAKQKYLSKIITFHGRVSETDALLELYNESDVFVLPSFHEGFPRVLFEAALTSLPIITTPVGSIPTMLKDGTSALFVPVRNAQSIANAIEKLIMNTALSRKISSNALKYVTAYLGQFNKNHAHQLKEHIEDSNND
jgi:glycosyltransferase involved in cell wall biosynthesis